MTKSGLVAVVALLIVTVMAGCHNKTSTVAISSDCRSQIVPARHLLMCAAAAAGKRDQMMTASPAAQASVSSSSSQPGHAPSRTNLPLENTGIGYLKKN